MYVGKLEPIAKFKAIERKYNKRNNKHSESKTVNNSQKQTKRTPAAINTLASQTMFDIALLHSNS